MTRIHLGISTCPNDTFAFHGILTKQVPLRGLDIRIELLDVETLNQRLFVGDFDVAKASFHAALLLAHELKVLPVGSALGFGVGPLLLAAKSGTHPRDPVEMSHRSRPARVLCPGKYTTATLLYKLFHPGEGQLQQTVFSDIMPALKTAVADFGVCIHEGRFTWAQHGLAMVEDLGDIWEQATSAPLPLGGILARHRLGDETTRLVVDVLRDSLEYGLSHRAETIPTMQHYAQELTEDVILRHVDLYVNQWTTDLGATGRTALRELSRQATAVGMLAPTSQTLTVF